MPSSHMSRKGRDKMRLYAYRPIIMDLDKNVYPWLRRPQDQRGRGCFV